MNGIHVHITKLSCSTNACSMVFSAMVRVSELYLGD